jgi:hypothetical protein
LSIFNLLTAGLSCGYDSLTKISRWCRTLSQEHAEALGFQGGRPSIATLSNILRRVSVVSVEKALGTYFKTDTQGQHIALDGKTLRGTTQDTVPLVHLLSIFMTENQSVINQIRMEEGENEITAATRFINETEIKGAIITGDAMFSKKKSAKRL